MTALGDSVPTLRSWRTLLLTSILLITAAVYASTAGFDFVYDDHAQIVDTTQFNSWTAVPNFFREHVWSWKTPGVGGTYYRPLFMVWLFLMHALFGLSPGGWHLASVAVHLAATVLVYLLAARLTRDELTGAISALLFGLHPVHLESVAWVSGIPDPLVAVFLLTSLLLYIRGDRTGRTLALLAFFAALLTKETAIVLPGIIFGYEWLLTGSSPRRWIRSIPSLAAYVAVLMVYLGIRWTVIHTFTTIINPISRRQMVFTWPSILTFYLTHLIWPFRLSIFYYLPVISQVESARVMVPALLLVLLGCGLGLSARRYPFAGFCALWMLLPILPALNIRVFQQNETVHDRYLYLPSIGFCMLAGFVIRRLGRRLSPRGMLLGQAAAVLLVAVAMVYGTTSQSGQWANDLALFDRGIQSAPENELAQQSMGTVLLRQNRPADATIYFERALEKNPNMWEAAYPLGRCYYELGMYAKAEPYFNRAAALKPWDPRAFLYYGLAQLKQGRIDLAEPIIRRAIAMRGPDDYQGYHAALGQVLEKKGNPEGARKEYEAETRENPESSEAAEGRLRVEGK